MRKLAAVLIVALAALFFLYDPEEQGIPLVDWIRDPAGSARENEATLERLQAEARRSEASPERLGAPLQSPGLPAATIQELAPVVVRSDPSGGPGVVAGRVRTLEGRAIAGLLVTALDPLLPPASSHSDAQGRFEIPPVQAGSRLRLDSPGWVLLGGDTLILAPGTPHELVVAERLDLDGRVTDTSGAPLEGAEVLGWTPLAAAAARELGVSLPSRFSASATSGADGAFSLHGLPRVPYTRLEVRKEGFARLRLDAPLAPEGGLVLVLEREPAQSDG